LAWTLKDRFLNKDFVRALGNAVARHDPAFDVAKFLKSVLDRQWASRELKARVRHLSQVLHERLPYPYERQIEILTAVAPSFDGLGAMVFPDFVETFGQDHFAVSVIALREFTPRFSSEFAVRPFLVRYSRRMLETMEQWARHESHHVRRLATEGCRPLLPWAMQLTAFRQDPAPVLAILEVLKADPHESVRRSVANNLNDISKDHPELVLKIAAAWMGQSAETDRILKHACRGLLKAGNRKALALFGYRTEVQAQVLDLSTDRSRLRIGEALRFRFRVRMPKPASVRLEYRVYFRKANGKTSPKVFQIFQKVLPAGDTTVERGHRFQNLTTRKHYPGEHVIAVAVNGVERAHCSIALEKEKPPARR